MRRRIAIGIDGWISLSGSAPAGRTGRHHSGGMSRKWIEVPGTRRQLKFARSVTVAEHAAS
ncbi:hypothetical protein [Microvirga sp. 17 mud 1-3]|uniref:hypothetical protein n=1 Tax=Microvirga sp. 17 mud 1-3 TaxID=2082949 RepID=UPI0013A54BC0|nr:hypothetical protein [Microvirga sp. 17 mud 1-3]